MGFVPGMHAAMGPALVQAQPAGPVMVQLSQSVKYPDVVQWFTSFDVNQECNNDNISFAQYGPILKDKGFLCLSQLTLEFFGLKDLQEWLEISVGMAVLIMQYAKKDMEDIQAGCLSFT